MKMLQTILAIIIVFVVPNYLYAYSYNGVTSIDPSAIPVPPNMVATYGGSIRLVRCDLDSPTNCVDDTPNNPITYASLASAGLTSGHYAYMWTVTGGGASNCGPSGYYGNCWPLIASFLSTTTDDFALKFYIISGLFYTDAPATSSPATTTPTSTLPQSTTTPTSTLPQSTTTPINSASTTGIERAINNQTLIIAFFVSYIFVLLNTIPFIWKPK